MVEYDYDAYGNLTRKVGDADNNYLFAGEQFEEAVDGYYNRARYYDPNTGRFASVDPFAGYNNQPITLHDYLYARNNPVIYIDPSGELAFIAYITTLQFSLNGEYNRQLGSGIGLIVGFGLTSIIAASEILAGTSSKDLIQNVQNKANQIIESLTSFKKVDQEGFVKGFIEGYSMDFAVQAFKLNKVGNAAVGDYNKYTKNITDNGGIKNGVLYGLNHLKEALGLL